MEVAVLVRAVVAASIDDRLGGEVAHAGGGLRIRDSALVIGVARLGQAITEAHSIAFSRTLGWASGGGSEPSGYRLPRQR